MVYLSNCQEINFISNQDDTTAFSHNFGNSTVTPVIAVDKRNFSGKKILSCQKRNLSNQESGLIFYLTLV
jgi:hypothetical protein